MCVWCVRGDEKDGEGGRGMYTRHCLLTPMEGTFEVGEDAVR